MRISSLVMTNVRGPKSPAEILIEQKHSEYARAAKIYMIGYYAIRLIAGLSAGVLPFIVTSKPELTLALSMTIVTCTVVDLVFGVRDKWKLMSKASDILAIERLKLSGEYEKYKNVLNVLLQTEDAKLEKLVDISAVIKTARDSEGSK